MTDGLRSGQVAAAAGVNQQTLRYYERRGLIFEPDRTLGGHRLYPPATVRVVRVIKAGSGSDLPSMRSRTSSSPLPTGTPAMTLGCTPGRRPSSLRPNRRSSTWVSSVTRCSPRWPPAATT